MIKITKIAQKHFLKILSKKKFNTQIRIFIAHPNTKNTECKISYCPPQTIKKTDIKLQFELISTYIDPISHQYLQGAIIDLNINPLGCELTLTKPNTNNNITQKTDNHLLLTQKIQNIIETQINPQLQNHGGNIELINITKDLFVIIKFTGSCNGCSMVPYTLKEAIENKLVNLFPEIQGIKDITEHTHGSHSYY